MTDPLTLIARHGLMLVFANVLLEQAGVPVPAVPALVLSGALVAEGRMSGAGLMAAAVAGCIISDTLWYFAGRRYGLRVLRLLCKISLSPDSCVRQTEDKYGRWGVLALVFGKFIPGVSTIAPPLAGAMKIGWGRFTFFSVLGSFLWAGAAVTAGMVFHREIAGLIDRMEELGTVAIEIVAALLALFIAVKWYERRRFFRMLRLARVTVPELRRLFDEGKRPVVVDVRSRSARASDARYIPGALAIDLAELDSRRAALPEESEIVFYCSCPNEASAALAAKQLMSLGYPRVRPLAGGLDEWIAAGYDVEVRVEARP
jgi:membrane protein DedA with SNARE-associated domain/rhodanese-related sulfurtransferase